MGNQKTTKKKVLSAYKKYIRKHKFSPTYAEIGEELGYTRGRISQIVRVLIEEKLLIRVKGSIRNIKIK